MSTSTAEEAWEILHALKRAGWSIGDAGFVGADGSHICLVTGTNGENRIIASGPTELDAWRQAERQASGLGTLRT